MELSHQPHIRLETIKLLKFNSKAALNFLFITIIYFLVIKQSSLYPKTTQLTIHNSNLQQSLPNTKTGIAMNVPKDIEKSEKPLKKPASKHTP